MSDSAFRETAVCLGAKIKGKLSVCRINRAGKIEDFNHRSEGKDFGKGAQTLTQCNFSGSSTTPHPLPLRIRDGRLLVITIISLRHTSEVPTCAYVVITHIKIILHLINSGKLI